MGYVKRTFLTALTVAALLLSAASLASADAQIVGVNVHPEGPHTLLSGTYDPATYNQVLDRMAAAGAQMVRVPVPWAWVQATGRGQYDAGYLATIDAYLAAVRRHGLKVLMLFGGTPCWATTDPGAVCSDGRYSAPDAIGGAYPPQHDADAGHAAAYMVTRWHPDALELYNEPNTPSFFSVPAGQDVAQSYSDLAKAIYPAVKAAAPATTVVVGALAESDTDFLRRLYADGIGSVSDAISVHPYNIEFTDPFQYWGDPAAAFPDNATASFLTGVPAIHDLMVANHDQNKPLWITELGFSACNPSYLCLDEGTQARYLQTSLSQIRAWPYVAATLLYQAADATTDGEGWTGFGLLRGDLTRRPAYCVLAQETGANPGCQSDPLSSERAAQDDLTRAWTLARGFYLSHRRSFSGLDAAALHGLDSSFTGYDLPGHQETTSAQADPKTIGLEVQNGGSQIDLCNVGPARAYCIIERTGPGANASVSHGEAPYDVFAAAGATRTGSSTAWAPASAASSVAVTLSPGSVVADGSSTTTATATVTDGAGHPVLGDGLSFSGPGSVGPVTDHHDGTYTAVLTSSTFPGSVTVTATDSTSASAVTAGAKLVQTVRPAATMTLRLSPSDVPADGHSGTTATATVTDVTGAPLAGERVGFVTGDGAQSIGPVSDHGDGTYTALLTSSTSAGPVTVTASDQSPSPTISAAATLVQSSPLPPPPATTQPVFLRAPSVTGPLAEGRTLRVAPGSWSGSPTPGLHFHWQRCAATCSDIRGATGPTLVLRASELGHRIRVRVTAVNQAGLAVASSALSGPVAAGAPTRARIASALGRLLRRAARPGRTGVFGAPVPGTLELSWTQRRGTHRRLAAFRLLVKEPGRVQISWRLSPQVRAALARVGPVGVRVQGRFTPTGQPPVRVSS